jgi:O-antigen ligase
VTTRATGLAALTTGGAAFLVPLLYAPSLQAPFLVPKFAALELCASLGLVAFALERVLTGRPRFAPAVAVGALLVFATSAVAWVVAATRFPGAPYGAAATARWASLFGLACGASVLADAPGPRQRVLEAVTIAAAVVAAIGLLQHVELMPLGIPVISTPGSTFGNRNLAAEVMAMALPLGTGAAARSPRRDTRAVLQAAVALELLYLAVTRTRGAWLGAACGLGTALWLARVRPSRTTLVAALGVVVAVGVAASVPGRFNPRDAGDAKRYSGVVEVLQEGFDARSIALRTRFGLWRRTVAMVGDHPWVGVGPGNWPVLFPRYAEPGAMRDGVLSATLTPRQAHDDLLERAAETGVVGLGALLFLAGGVAAAVRRSLETDDDDRRAHTAGATGALVALGVLSLSSFPLEMPGTLALAGLSLGLAAVDRARPAAARMPSAAVYAVVAGGLALVAGTAVRAERAVRGSFWLGRAERTMRTDAGSAGAEQAITALKRALQATPNDYRARLRTTQMLLRAGQAADAADAARQVIALEPYSPNGWAALAGAQLAQGNQTGARHAADEALQLLSDYPAALQLRAQAAEEEGDSSAARADRKHLAELAAGSIDPETARRARALLSEGKK